MTDINNGPAYEPEYDDAHAHRRPVEIIEWTTQQQADRVSICAACPKFDAEWMCTECGCYIPAKVRKPDESCPLGKW